MLAAFFVALISYCIYQAGDFLKGIGIFFLALVLTAFVVAGVYLTFDNED